MLMQAFTANTRIRLSPATARITPPRTTTITVSRWHDQHPQTTRNGRLATNLTTHDDVQTTNELVFEQTLHPIPGRIVF